MDYEEIICDANNLYRAYKVSVKTSKWKETTQKFMMNFLRYIFSIQDVPDESDPSKWTYAGIHAV